MLYNCLLRVSGTILGFKVRNQNILILVPQSTFLPLIGAFFRTLK